MVQFLVLEERINQTPCLGNQFNHGNSQWVMGNTNGDFPYQLMRWMQKLKAELHRIKPAAKRQYTVNEYQKSMGHPAGLYTLGQAG